MSDVEDDPFTMDEVEDENPPPAAVADPEDEDEADENVNAPPPPRGRGSDDEDDEDDEEDEEDEDEEDGGDRGKKRAKRRHRRPAVNRFLDVEAEVDEDEEEEEDDEDLGGEGFIADPGAEGEDDDHPRVSASAFRRDRNMDERSEDLDKLAQGFRERARQAAPMRYSGDMNEVPQRLLMPSVHDANLWQVRVKQGKERDIVLSLMRKSIDLEFTPRPLEILSAFQRDSLPGMIYVEARSSKQVSYACQGLVGVYISRGVTLVPIEEMASLLLIKKQEVTVTPGSWVRMRRGKYAGDLAQVVDITENGEEVGLKFIPRIDLNPRDDTIGPDGKKRKKLLPGGSNMRPPQRFFNFEEVQKVYGRKAISKRNQVFVFQNDTYKDGFIEKDFRITALQLDDVNPTLDEITMFARGQDGTENENAVDLSIIAEASRKAAIAVLQPGDHVEVFEGEQSGVHGVVQSVQGNIVTITASGMDLDGQKIDLPARSVRKRFKAGDHVKVMSGKNANETGLVVAVADNVVTFLSDMSMQEVSVFSKDLREAAEVGTSTNIIGNYELHDLVQLDPQTVGVIFKTEHDSFRVLDQNGQVRLVQPHQIAMRRDSRRVIAIDSEGHELHINDNVKEIDGESRKGRLVHVHQSFFAFLHNRDIAENGGVFVTRVRSLASVVPKGSVVKTSMDTTKMNPAMTGGAAAGGMVGSMMRGPRDRLQGVNVTVIKGPHKGYIGIIKDTNGPFARVEISSKSKVITIEKDKLRRRNPDGKLEALEGLRPFNGPGNGRPGAGFSNPGNSFGGSSPQAWGIGGATPGWGAGGKTPGWGGVGGGKTPAWNAGAATPAWNPTARTPNPYAGGAGKTPAWDASARTPNPYTANAGGKTPGWGDGGGGRTPNPYTTGAAPGWASPSGAGTAGGSNGAWGNTSPARTQGSSSSAWGGWGNDSWDNSSSAGAAAASAPTPGAYAFTPAAAATPAPFGVYDEGENANQLDPLWLVQLDTPNKAGLLVELHGTDVTSAAYPTGYAGGVHEGKRGVVKTAAATALSAGGTTTVSLSGGEDIFPPPAFLLPVNPTDDAKDKHRRALVLSGPYKGQAVKMVNKETDDTWVAMREGGAYDYFNPAHLCLYEE